MMRISLTGDKYVNETLNACLTTYKDQSGEILFVGKEVADGLGYQNTRHAITRLVDVDDRCRLLDFKGGPESCPPCEGGVVSKPPRNKQPHTILINESGLYSLILRSNKPEAMIFQRWITKEVLPSIRKSGFYALPEVLIAIKGIELDDVRELDGEERKEFRKESKIRSDLAKDPNKVLLGEIGGKVTQDRIRDLKEDLISKVLRIGTLEEENKSLRIQNLDLEHDVRDIIDWAKDFRDATKLVGN